MGNAMQKRGHVILDKKGLSDWLTPKQSSSGAEEWLIGSGGAERMCQAEATVMQWSRGSSDVFHKNSEEASVKLRFRGS